MTCSNLFAQTYDSLETSVLSVKIKTGAALFNDPVNSTAGFTAEEVGVIFAANFWFSAQDFNSGLHTSTEMFGNDHDFQYGPVMNNPADYVSSTVQFNRIWKINRNDIYAHQLNFSNVGYVIPQSILDWPGNAPIGAVAVWNLAPYYDYNLNGTYDPQNGDYPIMKGDEALYFIKNDDTIHENSGGLSSKIETHYLIYKFDCALDSILERTIFMDIVIYNRSTTTYYDTYFGIWSDFDLGFSQDDFIGTDVENGMIYCYNGDAFDDAGMGQFGFGANPPATGIVFLGGAYADEDAVDNPLSELITNCIDSLGIPYANLGTGYDDAIIDNERLGLTNSMFYFDGGGPIPAIGSPTTANDYYNYMRSIWLDGSHLYYGGMGHSTSPDAISNGLIPCNYYFSGDSDSLWWNTKGDVAPQLYDWDENNIGNVPGDRRLTGSSGPFTFMPGQKQELALAFIYARDTAISTMPSLDLLQEYAEVIHNYYKADSVPCHTSFTVGFDEIVNEDAELTFLLFPNPATDKINLLVPNELLNSTLQIVDALGRIVYTEDINSVKLEISTNRFSSGYYFVRIRNEKKIYTQKLILSVR